MLTHDHKSVISIYIKTQTEKTDLDIALSYTAAPAGVFNPDFNNFTHQQPTKLGPFTAGRDDGALGSNPELGDYSTTFW